MATPLTASAAAAAFSQAIRDSLTATALGAPASVKPSAAEGPGWIVSARVSGAASGTLAAWFDREGAIACATKLLGLGAAPNDDAVVPVLTGLVGQAMTAVEGHLAGVLASEPTAEPGSAAKSAQAVTATWADALTCRFAVWADLTVASATDNASLAADGRLDAVLDVDLPLVVRFGRTVVPLRAVADLSPGSVVDMGRSPDEPVELLVGERLIARGEVVIVGGNYGVRITELTGSRRSSDVEARS
jgi:flagellar motor switch protein FliN/FliY